MRRMLFVKGYVQGSLFLECGSTRQSPPRKQQDGPMVLTHLGGGLSIDRRVSCEGKMHGQVVVSTDEAQQR